MNNEEKKIRCPRRNCGLRLFNEDIVDVRIEISEDGLSYKEIKDTYRCPKCFSIYKVPE